MLKIIPTFLYVYKFNETKYFSSLVMIFFKFSGALNILCVDRLVIMENIDIQSVNNCSRKFTINNIAGFVTHPVFLLLNITLSSAF